MNKLFGEVLRGDRNKLRVSQSALQQRVKKIFVNSSSMPDFAKDALLKTNRNGIRIDGKYYWAQTSAKLISNIERGVTKFVSKKERILIAEALGVDKERYIHLEVDPLVIIRNARNVTPKAIENLIERSIEFEPQFRQAGVSILSFFAEVLNKEYKGKDVKTAIIQEGNKVTLRIETPEGVLVDEIDRTLENYGMVVMGKMPIDTFTSDKELIRDLKTKLEVTNLELKLRQEYHLENSKQNEGRICLLENQVNQLTTLIGTSLKHIDNFTDLIAKVGATEELSASLKMSMKTISMLASSNNSTNNEVQLRKAFEDIRKTSPSLYKRLLTTLEGVPASIASSLLSPWVQSIISMLPK